MEWIREKLRIRARTAALMVCEIAAFAYLGPAVHATTAQWSASNLDSWYYTNAASSGTRALAPTFLGGVSIDENTQQFEPGTFTDPARLGQALIAFNTSTLITHNLAVNRYQINSITVKATWTYDLDSNKLLYQDTPVTHEQMLSEVIAGNVSRQKPMELYGVGMRDEYTGFAFGGSGSKLLSENTPPYSASDGGYLAYPIIGTNTPGSYIDVSNSVTGGDSATAPLNTTAPFTPTPWAIGATNLSAGDEIPDKSTFTFELDLNAPGVVAYAQESLAKGGFGVFLSSLNSTGEFGGGGGYPRWYTKEAGGFPYFVPTATTVPGDYNVNDLVDAADYVQWRKGGALQNQVDDPSQVNAGDYTASHHRYGNTSYLPHLIIDYTILPAGSGSSFANNGSIPEPPGPWLSFFASVFVSSSILGRNRIWRRNS